MEVKLHVTYTAKPGCREAFVRNVVTEGVLTAVRAEEGCLGYDYYFSAQEEDVVLLVERWESEAHLRVHMTQPHMATLRQLKEKFLLSTRLMKVQEEPYAL